MISILELHEYILILFLIQIKLFLVTTHKKICNDDTNRKVTENQVGKGEITLKVNKRNHQAFINVHI